jgi:hypothetical protein
MTTGVKRLIDRHAHVVRWGRSVAHNVALTRTLDGPPETIVPTHTTTSTIIEMRMVASNIRLRIVAMCHTQPRGLAETMETCANMEATLRAVRYA